MKISGKGFATWLGLVLLLGVAAPACVVAARPAVRVRVAPPAPRYEQEPAQRSGYVWVAGHWQYVGGEWVWKRGYWQRAQRDHVWVPGHWEHRGEYHHWVPGHWQPVRREPPRRVSADDGDAWSNNAPPPPRVVRQPAPRPGFIWVQGRWEWRSGAWRWRRGHWIQSRMGYRWVPGHWERRGARHRWVPGHWQR